jgi:hypothetical protein
MCNPSLQFNLQNHKKEIGKRIFNLAVGIFPFAFFPLANDQASKYIKRKPKEFSIRLLYL